MEKEELIASSPKADHALSRPLWRRAAGWVWRLVWRSRPVRLMWLPFEIAFNNTLIISGLDGAYVRWRSEWQSRPFSKKKSLQENVGFSHREDVDEALRRVHEKLRLVVETEIAKGSRILDVGAGTGLVARQLVDHWRVVGIDISPALTEAARATVPEAEFHVGDVTATRLEGDFAMAYSIGVVQYIPPSLLRQYLANIAGLLADRGVFFLQYPHPIHRTHLLHPNLLYTRYEPRFMEKLAGEFFDVMEHHHSFFFDKKVDRLDPDPYPKDSFVNGYLYIGRKRSGRAIFPIHNRTGFNAKLLFQIRFEFKT